MKHHASPDFWACYRALPRSVRELADRDYERLKADPRHPSLHFKKVGRFWSVSGVINPAHEAADGLVWF